MRFRSAFFSIVLLGFSPLPLLAEPSPQARQVVMAVAQSLDFNEGDTGSLMDAEEQFTPPGWKEFLASMKGYIDAKGAPMYSSSFTPTGDPTILGQDGSTLRLSIPGKLKQQHGVAAGTTYTVEIDVEAVGHPLRIDHLKQKMVSKADGGTR